MILPILSIHATVGSIGQHGLAMDRLEAHQILFKGQSNVLLMSREVGCSLEEMQESFRVFVAANPIEGDEWEKDIELSWPFA